MIARPQQRQVLSGLSLNTLSQPKPGNSAQASPQVQPEANSSQRYKTELCRSFQENGACKYGDKCQFAHGTHELRSMQRHPKYKTELCRTFHAAGYCPYGPRCHFVHDTQTDVQLSVKLASLSSSSSSSSSSSTSSQSTSPLSLSRLHLDEIDSLFENASTTSNSDLNNGRSSLLMVSTNNASQPRKDSISSSSSSSGSYSPEQSSRSLSPAEFDLFDPLKSTDLIVTQILSNIYLDDHSFNAANQIDYEFASF